MMTYTLHYFPVHCDIEITRRPYGNAALIAFYLFDFCDLSFGHSPESETQTHFQEAYVNCGKETLPRG
jgi:hypothetical protein